MKTKWFFVYIGVGVAFAAVSLWVFLSGGKNARAIRAKYKLGGMMLLAWGMLSSATCDGPGPMITCYDPVVTCYDVAMINDELHVSIKGKEGSELSAGDILLIRIATPTAEKYTLRITPAEEVDKVLQEASFSLPETGEFDQQWPFNVGNYTGEVTVWAYAVRKDENGKESEEQIGACNFTVR